MRIASFTMIGQFPHGIDLHIRNLKWALNKEDSIFIVTLPEFIKTFKLKNDNQITYIPYMKSHSEGFINFWKYFPKILERLNIDPEWFLFMEEDIYFHNKIVILPKEKEIVNYLLPQTTYKAIFVNDKLYHPRVWEGGNLIHKHIVRDAIKENVSFSFVNKKDYFYRKNELFWEEKVNGKIKLNWNDNPDTFDEFGLYCALVKDTKVIHHDKSVHLRGPESLHRQFPYLYKTCKEEDLIKAKQKLNYLCIYTAIAVYYIVGNWKGNILWENIQNKYKLEFSKILPNAKEWMKIDEYERLKEIIDLITNPY